MPDLLSEDTRSLTLMEVFLSAPDLRHLIYSYPTAEEVMEEVPHLLVS